MVSGVGQSRWHREPFDAGTESIHVSVERFLSHYRFASSLAKVPAKSLVFSGAWFGTPLWGWPSQLIDKHAISTVLPGEPLQAGRSEDG